MEPVELTSSDIINIIEASGKNHVRELSFKSLQLKFGQPEEVKTINYAPENPLRVAADLEAEELKLRQQDLELLRIEDPLQYEEMISKRELELHA